MAFDLAGMDLEGLADEVAALRRRLDGDIDDLSDVELLEDTGETTEIMLEGGDEETGARRRIKARRPKMKKHRVVKKSKDDLKTTVSKHTRQLTDVEAALRSLAASNKSKRGKVQRQKDANVGSRAEFTASAVNLAAGATVTPAAQTANTPRLYGGIYYTSNTPALVANALANGNPLADGGGTVAVSDSVPTPLRRLAEPVELASGSGFVFTVTNRGAAAGDITAHLVPLEDMPEE